MYAGALYLTTGRRQLREKPALRALCPAAEIPPGGTRAFAAAEGAAHGLFAVHHFREGILLYVNACPHLGVPLDWLPGQFLSLDGTRIVCATHGAEFRIVDGYCMRGPCRGEALTKVPSTCVDDMIMVAEDAGRTVGKKIGR